MLSQKQLREQISQETDEVLLQWLTAGRTYFSGSFDKAGEPIYVTEPLTPAMMRCVLTRLAQLGITTIAAKGTPAGNLAEAAAARGIGMKFQGQPLTPPGLPPLSAAADAATA